MRTDPHQPDRGGSAVPPGHAQLQERAAAFVDEVLIPLEVTAELAGGPLPVADQERVRAKAVEYGVHGGSHAREHGGNGWSVTEWFLVEEQFGRSTNGVSWYIPTAYNVWKHASPAQQERWLLPALRGELHDAYAVTEAEAGSDPSGMTTTARPLGDGRWVINGEKWFVTYGSIAAVIVVMAYAEVDGQRLPTLFAVPADAPGIAYGKKEEKMGWNSQPTRTISFDQVRVPATSLLGQEGEGFRIAMKGLDGGRINIATCSIGAAQGALSTAQRYLHERRQFGRPLADFQALQFKLADMATELVAARQMVRLAASKLDAGHTDASVYCAMAKRFATDVGFEVCNQALQIHGGYGYIREYPLERLLRDARVHQILEGTNEIMRVIIARRMLQDNATETIR